MVLMFSYKNNVSIPVRLRLLKNKKTIFVGTNDPEACLSIIWQEISSFMQKHFKCLTAEFILRYFYTLNEGRKDILKN